MSLVNVCIVKQISLGRTVPCIYLCGDPAVLVLDGNSERGAQKKYLLFSSVDQNACLAQIK